VGARPEVDRPDELGDPAVAVDGQHPAVAIEPGEDVALAAEPVGEITEDGTRDAERLVALASLRELVGREERSGRAMAGSIPYDSLARRQELEISSLTSTGSRPSCT
jgi:hypothetical protein